MTERRISERRRMVKGAKIVWNRGGSVLDCTLRNVSKTGAMLEVFNAITVPDAFELRWDNNTRRQQCIVVRRKLDSVGVKFDAGP